MFFSLQKQLQYISYLKANKLHNVTSQSLNNCIIFSTGWNYNIVS